MQPVIITDTTCLILLEKINELTLLQRLFRRVIITQTIADEFGNALPEWIRILNPQDQKTRIILEASLESLHPGHVRGIILNSKIFHHVSKT
jgi:predicted nucleic acid-binding protein